MIIQYNSVHEVAQTILNLRAQARRKGTDLGFGFDLDGTLADFNRTNVNAVDLPGETREDIKKLNTSLGGAVAMATGRNPEFIDKIFRGYPIAGSFNSGGKIRRIFNGVVEALDLAVDEAKLHELIQPHRQQLNGAGCWVEEKFRGLAVHWGRATGSQKAEAEKIARIIVPGIIAGYNEGRLSNQHIKAEEGDDVFEIGHIFASKGQGMRDLWKDAPFIGRIPIFIGDSPADKSGMQEALDRGGLAIGVGEKAPNIVQFRLKSPEDTRQVVRVLVTAPAFAA